jgi:DNA-binding NarL/FixJ family response regulator
VPHASSVLGFAKTSLSYTLGRARVHKAVGITRILIVDDHPAVRRSLRSLVQSRAGWEVCGEAADGLDALEKAKQFKPDVILLDISMPRMNGIEATPVIHREVPQSEIFIVTQYETPEMARLVAEAGAQGYVPKSPVWTALVPAIESVVSPEGSKATHL